MILKKIQIFFSILTLGIKIVSAETSVGDCSKLPLDPDDPSKMTKCREAEYALLKKSVSSFHASLKKVNFDRSKLAPGEDACSQLSNPSLIIECRNMAYAFNNDFVKLVKERKELECSTKATKAELEKIDAYDADSDTKEKCNEEREIFFKKLKEQKDCYSKPLEKDKSACLKKSKNDYAQKMCAKETDMIEHTACIEYTEDHFIQDAAISGLSYLGKCNDLKPTCEEINRPKNCVKKQEFDGYSDECYKAIKKACPKEKDKLLGDGPNNEYKNMAKKCEDDKSKMLKSFSRASLCPKLPEGTSKQCSESIVADADRCMGDVNSLLEIIAEAGKCSEAPKHLKAKCAEKVEILRGAEPSPYPPKLTTPK